MKHKAEYYNKGEWIVCKPLDKDCETVVDDLVGSASITQNWPEKKKQQYFHRAISIACDMTTRKPKSKWRKISNKLVYGLIHNFFCFASRLAVYVR